MFGKSEPKRGGNGREKGGAPVRLLPGESTISIIGAGMHVQGDISSEGIVRIEGSVHGSVHAAKAVVLGKEGEVVGDIVTQDAVLGGRVSGSVVAESRLELQNTCVVEGDIQARAEHLKLDEGARFNGQIQMIDAAGSAPATAPTDEPAVLATVEEAPAG